jgi:hypothetical protein
VRFCKAGRAATPLVNKLCLLPHAGRAECC